MKPFALALTVTVVAIALSLLVIPPGSIPDFF